MDFKTRLQVTANGNLVSFGSATLGKAQVRNLARAARKNGTTFVLASGGGVDVRYTFEPDEYARAKKYM